MSARRLTIETDDRVVIVDSPRVDYVREGLTALGWFILDRSPLAFLREQERELFCDAPLARHLPKAIPLSDVLARLP
jgi:hypothetical protein